MCSLSRLLHSESWAHLLKTVVTTVWEDVGASVKKIDISLVAGLPQVAAGSVSYIGQFAFFFPHSPQPYS